MIPPPVAAKLSVSDSTSPMRKVFKVVGFIGVTLLLFFIVCALAFYHLISTGEFRRFLIEEVEKQTDLKVQLGEADIEIGWVTGVAFGHLAVSEPDAAQAAITAERVTARVALTPLLQRRVIFYEIRLQKPTAQFVRDKEGRIPLLDRLRNLPFLRRQDSQFSLDLRSIKVQNGVIDFTDRWPEGAIGSWRLVETNLDLERVRGQRLRDFMKDLFKRQPAERSAVGLTFDLKGALVKDDAKTSVKTKGRLLLPGEPLDFQQARWNAEVDLVNFPATLVKEYLGARMPINAISGQLAQRIYIDGNATRQMHFKGDLDFKQFSLDAPEVFLQRLGGTDGRVSFEADWSPQRLQVARVDYRANEVKFSLQGEVSGLDRDDPNLRFNFSALTAPVAAWRRYLPLKLLDSPQLERAVNSIQAGQMEIKRGGLDASLSSLRRLAQTGIGKQLWFEAEVRDAAGGLGIDGMLPLRNVQGRLSLADGVLKVRDFRGSYGDSRVTDIDGSYDLSSVAVGKFEAQAHGEFNLAELREQAKAKLFSAQAAKFATSIQELAGRGRIDLNVKRSAGTAVEFDGKLGLDNGRLRYEGYPFSELKGDLTFTPREIKGEKIRGQLSGAPIQIQFTLKDYAADNGAFELAIDSPGIKAGVVTTLLLDSGTPQDPGTVRGAVRYSGSFNNKDRRIFTGNLELTNVQVALHPLLQPLRELNGKINIEEKGIEFQNLRANLVGFPASFSGRWRYAEKPQLLFDFAAPNLDVTYLISQIDPEVGEFYTNLQAEGKISLGKGRIKNLEFADLKTDATIDRRVWRLTNLTGRSSGGTIVGGSTIFDRPDTLGIAAEPKIQAVPVQAFLKWFDVTNTEMTGRVNLTGKLETVGKNDIERKQNLNGAFNLRIEDGTINRMRLLVQLLNLLDLSRWFTFQFPDLTKQGIRFRAITGDFKVTKGVYSTENLVVDSNDLRMTGVGKIDVPKDELEFILAVRPFAGIDAAINQIPILGRGIAALKNSFLVASFNVTGKIDDPTITPAPLGTISEMFWSILGLPKSIIGLGEGEKKEEPKEPAKAPTK
jgi:uncharacterized protein involved in outer membrane biogenesis